MSKKPQTRDSLLAALAELDNSTEVSRLQAEIARLTAEVSSLVSQRTALEKENRSVKDTLSAIHGVLRGGELRQRTHGTSSTRAANLQGVAQRTATLASAQARLGIQQGTHDPDTGLPFTKDTKPQRDLSAGAPQVTEGELAAFFPALSGPTVDSIEE
ncbi:hypothetical protein GOB08_11725 [Sinorhizobium meliloti]|nr:hypothetical protein [Sinorhizobium meliloti]MDX0449598.1 hypothetical protein [Sinorhizobium medicae]MDX1058348.1 hypothetical protein [Sinorhizobium medicae]